MREYILYSILIFLPIGYILSFYLRREGLAKKHITIFVAIAMIMIIFFPITAERLGVFSTGLVYILLLLIMIWYFIKTNQLDYLFKPPVTENTNEGLINLTVPAAVKDVMPIENEVFVEQSTANTLITEQQQGKESIQEYIEPVAENDFIDDNGQDKNSVSEAAAASEVVPIESKLDILEKPATEKVAIPVKEVPETVPEDIPPEVSTEDKLDTVISEEVEIDWSETLNNEEIIENEIISADISADITDVIEEEIFVPINEHIVNEVEINDELKIPEPALEASASLPIVLPEIPEETINEEEEAAEPTQIPTNDKQQEVISLIDKAFAIKSYDLRQAADNFQAALDICENDELMYLLTMELWEDYKEIGMYTKAAQILSDFIDRKAALPDIIDQMANNLIYLQIMINELKRLGTPELPFSKVPRWIRLKVAEEIKLLDN